MVWAWTSSPHFTCGPCRPLPLVVDSLLPKKQTGKGAKTHPTPALRNLYSVFWPSRMESIPCSSRCKDSMGDHCILLDSTLCFCSVWWSFKLWPQRAPGVIHWWNGESAERMSDSLTKVWDPVLGLRLSGLGPSLAKSQKGLGPSLAKSSTFVQQPCTSSIGILDKA